MKVHLIKKETIENFMQGHADSKPAFRYWTSLLKGVNWNTPADIMQTFGAADLLGKGTDRVVFDIGGNNYRMICSYFFGKKSAHLYIKWIGMHSQYDKLCDKTLQYTINLF
jgi:mRNA interferase HigB